MPESFPARQPLPESQGASLADLKWFEVFRDPQLDDLIKVALGSKLRSARCRCAGRRGASEPRHHSLQPIPAGERLRKSPVHALVAGWIVSTPASFNQNRNWGEAALNLLSFQVDLWGQLRRATEVARANLLNADWNRETVITTVVSQVAADYFQLLELDSELRISQNTLETRQESLEPTQDREAHGIATQLDVRQAEQLVDSAAENIPQLKQQIEQTEDQEPVVSGKSICIGLQGIADTAVHCR